MDLGLIPKNINFSYACGYKTIKKCKLWMIHFIQNKKLECSHAQEKFLETISNDTPNTTAQVIKQYKFKKVAWRSYQKSCVLTKSSRKSFFLMRADIIDSKFTNYKGFSLFENKNEHRTVTNKNFTIQ